MSEQMPLIERIRQSLSSLLSSLSGGRLQAQSASAVHLPVNLGGYEFVQNGQVSLLGVKEGDGAIQAGVDADENHAAVLAASSRAVK